MVFEKSNAIVFSLLLFVPTAAWADDKEQCATSYEDAQRLRQRGELSKASDRLKICVATCPGVLKADCERWQNEIAEQRPTVVLRARDAKGTDVVDVRVYVDGTLITERLDDKARELEAGDHVLRFEYEGVAPVEERISVGPGDDRNIVVVFPDLTLQAQPDDPLPVVPFVIGGIGLAAMVTGGALGLVGHFQRSDSIDDCPDDGSSTCSDADVDERKQAIVTLWIAGGVTAGVGLAAVGVATYMLATHEPSEEARAWPLIIALPDGGYAGVGGRF